MLVGHRQSNVPLFIEVILICHSGKSTDGMMKLMMAAFQFAALFSGSWYCACWLTVTLLLNGAVPFFAMTTQNICCEKGMWVEHQVQAMRTEVKLIPLFVVRARLAAKAILFSGCLLKMTVVKHGHLQVMDSSKITVFMLFSKHSTDTLQCSFIVISTCYLF